MQLKITKNGKQNYSKICLEKSVHYIAQYIEKLVDLGYARWHTMPKHIISKLEQI